MIELSNNISEYIKSTFGNDYYHKYQNFVESKYPISIRLRDSDFDKHQTLKSLKEQGVELEPYNVIKNAYRVLKGEEIIGKTVEHTLGRYYIQSLSSMIPPLVLNPSRDDVVLDLCAAPGSKSTQLSELMEYKGTLYSNEPNLNRVKALIHNLDKMNTVNMCVIKDKGELVGKKFPNFFDKVLVDAPCSALGVVQKKQEVSNWWNPKSVDKISQLQLKLLISAIRAAKVGAEIVYSTCTLTVEENEYILDKVIKKYPVKIVEFELSLPHINGFTKIGEYNFDDSLKFTKRIIPWEIRSEGFFVSKLVKTEEIEAKNIKLPKPGNKIFVAYNNKKFNKYFNELSDYFGFPKNILENYKFVVNNKDINFINSDMLEYEPSFFIRVGTKFGVIDKNDHLKLNSHAAQIIGQYATRNIIALNDSKELKSYLSGGVFNKKVEGNGQKIVHFNNLILGTAVVNNNQIKSQFPRSKRTGAILIPEN